MTMPSVRPPWTWVGAMVGLGGQTVVTFWVAVAFFVDASGYHRSARAKGGFAHAGFSDDLGAFLTVVGAVIVLVGGLLLVLTLVLSRRPGGRRLAGFIVGLVVQVPLVWGGIGAAENGLGVGETVVLVCAALFLLAVATPPAWRWCTRPAPVPGQ